MSELSGALGGSAPKHSFTANGVRYSVSLVTQAAKVAFERELFQKAREGITAMRADLDSDQYLMLIQRLTDAYENGDFSLEGERGRKALKSHRGAVLLLSILMGVDQQEVLKALLANEQELLAVFRVVMKESFPGVSFETPKESEDPNGPKASVEPLSAPPG